MKSYNTMAAKDMLFSLANKLPQNLVVDAVNEHGMFTAALLLRLKEENLCDLRKEARKHKNNPVFLFFFKVSEKELGKKAPFEVRDSEFTTFDFSKVVNVLFNGSTAPLLDHNYLAATHYVSVTLVVKD